jgi:hypothetical protein
LTIERTSSERLKIVETGRGADALMRVFNPDGSEAEMCGNGIRCVGKYLYETGTQKKELIIETIAGRKELSLTVEKGLVTYLTVDMDAPLDVSLDKRLEIDGDVWEYSFVDTGVPHVVIYSSMMLNRCLWRRFLRVFGGTRFFLRGRMLILWRRSKAWSLRSELMNAVWRGKHWAVEPVLPLQELLLFSKGSVRMMWSSSFRQGVEQSL